MTAALPPAPEHVPDGLNAFAVGNPEALVKVVDGAYHILRPWDDESVTIRVSFEAQAAADALNALRLPPTFSAIWHIDTRDLEFIYGPSPTDGELRQRSFLFAFEGREFRCEFTDSSDRLMALANAARPTGPPTRSDHRNLSALRGFLRFKSTLEKRNEPVDLALTSFWIRACGVAEKDLPSLARHLNFYMRYFDRRSPMIIVHENPGTPEIATPSQFPFGPFPNRIAARPLDPYMLTLWDSGLPRETEPVRSFLYNYQILEYAAFYYLKEELARAIRRILSAPDITSRAEEASRRILDTLVDERTSEEAKITSVIQQTVEPSLLWAEIAGSAFFSKPTDFDGGFSLPALIKEQWTLEDFKMSWIPKLPDAFRKLRNALLHAREQRLAKCIAPTLHNADLLRHWSNLIAVVSSQIILFGDS